MQDGDARVTIYAGLPFRAEEGAGAGVDVAFEGAGGPFQRRLLNGKALFHIHQHHRPRVAQFGGHLVILAARQVCDPEGVLVAHLHILGACTGYGVGVALSIKQAGQRNAIIGGAAGHL